LKAAASGRPLRAVDARRGCWARGVPATAEARAFRALRARLGGARGVPAIAEARALRAFRAIRALRALDACGRWARAVAAATVDALDAHVGRARIRLAGRQRIVGGRVAGDLEQRLVRSDADRAHLAPGDAAAPADQRQ
jgi:hypothetical protein